MRYHTVARRPLGDFSRVHMANDKRILSFRLLAKNIHLQEIESNF